MVARPPNFGPVDARLFADRAAKRIAIWPDHTPTSMFESRYRRYLTRQVGDHPVRPW